MSAFLGFRTTAEDGSLIDQIHERKAAERGGGKIADPADQLAYIVSAVKPGRKIRFTLHNTRTDKHLTYQVETARGPVAISDSCSLAMMLSRPVLGRRRFVSVLTAGSDNEGSYTYLGTIFDRGEDKPWKVYGSYGARLTRWHYYRGKKSPIGPEAVSVRAWLWLWCSLIAGKALPEGVRFWHEGRCGRCGRTLTDPESCARGLGPTCAGKGAA